MAKIERTQDLGSYVTRQDLWDLIGTSRLVSLAYDDLSAAGKAAAVYSSSLPPAAPVPGHLWWDTVWGVMRSYDSVSGLWLGIGPDSYELPALAAHPIFRGAAVEYDPDLTASSGYPWVRASSHGREARVCGLAQNTAASGGYVPVLWYGYGVGLNAAVTLGAWGAYGIASGTTGLLEWRPAWTDSCATECCFALAAECVSADSGALQRASLCSAVRYVGPTIVRLS